MSTDSNYVVVLTTTSNEAQADELAKKILAQKLAACIQIQQIKSHYVWQGEPCCAPECLLFIKTRQQHYQALELFIRNNHDYDTPEIIQLPITAGFSGYLQWIDEETNSQDVN